MPRWRPRANNRPGTTRMNTPKPEHRLGISGSLAARFLQTEITPLLALVGLLLGRFIAAEEEQLQNGEPEQGAVAGLDATDP